MLRGEARIQSCRDHKFTGEKLLNTIAYGVIFSSPIYFLSLSLNLANLLTHTHKHKHKHIYTYINSLLVYLQSQVYMIIQFDKLSSFERNILTFNASDCNIRSI